jgi:hypothetical protein
MTRKPTCEKIEIVETDIAEIELGHDVIQLVQLVGLETL